MLERQLTRIDTVRQYVDEILKDADVMQHWLRNPVEEYFFAQPRVQKLIEEFQLAIPQIAP